ncbi:MAG: hypothetical protein Kow0063_21320 [Anaerolineae bacterium]
MAGVKSEIEVVHVIFKTHLDVGFTDLGHRVVAKYFEEYIPQACQVARVLRQRGGPERFVWTTGSWLIYTYLEHASSQDRKMLEEAIEAGDIVWHGLPFTMHCELMDASLFRHGLSLSRALDRRFGRKTVAAKMSDVPGHTRAIVPLLAEAGIKFLHIGVNEASTAPAVPPAFVWRDDQEGAEVIVVYQRSYGDLLALPGMTHALAFAHTLDNLGPQSSGEVLEIFQKLWTRFPQAQIMASNLNVYTHELLRSKLRFPVVTQEIGDTWIHGVGTDPKKVSQFREICRLRGQWVGDNRVDSDSRSFLDFSTWLLMMAEHTWGLDEKTHLDDYVNYSRDRFAKARGQANFKVFESSWAEKRAYLHRAVEALGSSPLAAEVHSRLDEIAPQPPRLAGFECVSDLTAVFDTRHFRLGFDASCGAISCLLDKRSGRQLASGDCLLGLFRYQTFSQADYDRFLRQYLLCMPDWAILDFSKPGIDQAGAQSKWWVPGLSRLFARQDKEGHHFILELALPEVCTTQYGGPNMVTLELHLPDREPALHLNLQWFHKPANRLPEAFWFSFCPCVRGVRGWQMEKMGRLISPLDVIRNGNRKLHAIDRCVTHHEGRNRLTIESLDAPLLAPGEPSLLNFNNRRPPLRKGMHFNLYNNVWGTNFPMWYEEDARFRFVLSCDEVMGLSSKS